MRSYQFSIRQMLAVIFIISVFLGFYSWLHNSIFVKDYYKAAFCGITYSTVLSDSNFLETINTDHKNNKISHNKHAAYVVFHIIGCAIGLILNVLILIYSVIIFKYLYYGEV